MKSIHKEELYIKKEPITDVFFDDNSIFFDIETTGFSPNKSIVYMIGCARKKGKYICIDQFFAEKPSEEKLIISAFIEILKKYNTIISFNGVGFDIPFLKAKCDTYSIMENFTNYNYLDIYKTISPIKALLKLTNYKQKNIEIFLGLVRDDKFSGGELINIYYDYVNLTDNADSKKEELFDILCLHNYEDVLGMMELLPILSYIQVLNGQFSICQTEVSPYKTYNKVVRDEFIITLTNDFYVPKRVTYKDNDFYVSMNKDKTMIRTPVLKEELKYFYPNYKDYYYLPAEDTAIHKSVATFVDNQYREKCKASNCYIKKNSEFIIQYSEIMKPSFKKELKSKCSYFELTEDFYSSDIMLRRYIEHIFNYIFPSKNG